MRTLRRSPDGVRNIEVLLSTCINVNFVYFTLPQFITRVQIFVTREQSDKELKNFPCVFLFSADRFKKLPTVFCNN